MQAGAKCSLDVGAVCVLAVVRVLVVCVVSRWVREVRGWVTEAMVSICGCLSCDGEGRGAGVGVGMGGWFFRHERRCRIGGVSHDDKL